MPDPAIPPLRLVTETSKGYCPVHVYCFDDAEPVNLALNNTKETLYHGHKIQRWVEEIKGFVIVANVALGADGVRVERRVALKAPEEVALARAIGRIQGRALIEARLRSPWAWLKWKLARR